MADLLIRKLDPKLIERLKRQAKENGRSMEAEARAIIEQGVKMTMAEWAAGMKELRKGDPPWQPGDPTNVELIHQGRRERDAALEMAIFGETYDEVDD